MKMTKIAVVAMALTVPALRASAQDPYVETHVGLGAIGQAAKNSQQIQDCLEGFLESPDALALRMGAVVEKMKVEINLRKLEFDFDTSLKLSLRDPLTGNALGDLHLECGSYSEFRAKKRR